MGGGIWSGSVYSSSTGAKISSGSTFAYDKAAKASGILKPHENLDPKKVAGPASPLAGQIVREARDNPDSPTSTPIIVGFDATGSMGTVPRIVQEKLAGLFGLLLRKGYCENPQVAVSAYGDYLAGDRVPLQISQFEADNRVDAALDQIVLEGGGGGNSGEQANLLWYYAAYHTVTDSWEKRGKKGYLFTIADEVALPLTPQAIKEVIGDGQPMGPIDNKGLVAELKKKWEPIILLINNSTAHWQGSEKFYKDLFGDKNVIVVEDPANIAETIAMVIGRLEDAVEDDDAVRDLIEAGATAADAKAVVLATSKVGGKRGSVVKGGVDFGAAETGVARL